MIGFTTLVFISSVVLGPLDTSKFCQAALVIIGGPILNKAWRLLGDRKPLRNVPHGYSLYGYGFIQAYLTAWRCAVCFPEFFKFLCAFAFWDAATGGLVGMFLLYINVQLQMLSTAGFILITVLFCIPGAMLSRRISSGSLAAVKKGCIFWLIWLMLNALSFIAVCAGPAQQTVSYLWAIPTGMGA